MKNNATRTIRSEEITIDVRICAALAANRGGEVYLAAIAPDMELTVITLDEAPDILPCFEEDDACLNLPNTSLLLCYNPAQVLKMGGKHYLTGPVILVRTNMDGEVISLTIDEVYLFQKYLESHSITLMADDQKLPCICMRFTKGKYAFIVATHTDREHIHNHIVYNSTALDGTRKFRDFLLSGLAVQRLSDLICLEHQLSVIEIKPYRERQKRTLYPPKESNRDRLCGVIDTILAEKPKDYEDFLQGLEQQGYEVKRGKYTSVKGARQKRFIRFRTLGAGYSEEELKAVISGEAEHHPRQKQKRIVPEQKFQMLVDIQAKLAEGKSMGYARWAKRYNLKEMSKTLIFLQENKIGSIEEMQEARGCCHRSLS